jgi:hypothetical protein
MNSPDSWQRLAAAARRAPDDRDLAAPYGFAARVAAQAWAASGEPISFFEHFSLRLSLRALGAACLLAVATAGASYPTLVKIFSDTPAPSLAVSTEAPAASPAAPDAEPASLAAPAAPEAPAASPASSDDPVAELVDIVS